MNQNYASLRQNKRSGSALWIALALLILLEVCASSILFAQIASYATVQRRNYISLTEASKNTKLQIMRKAEARAKTPVSAVALGASSAGVGFASNRSAGVIRTSVTEQGGFEISDANTVWTTDTEVEIFKISYDNNGDAVFTVNSGNGKKVIAPGTENVYSFTLRNTGDVSLDYKLEVDAWITGTDKVIPVEAKLYDFQNQYLAGSADTWATVSELDAAEITGVLASGNIADYTLRWQWPFERGEGDELNANDEIDTFLGDLAVEGDVELHILIHTVAEADDNPDEPGGENPPTGDNGLIPVLSVTVAVILVLIIALIAERKKRQFA